MYTELLSPLYGTVKGLPAIAVGALVDGLSIYYVILDDDGKMTLQGLSDFVVDIRFRDGKWHDVSPESVLVEVEDA